MTVDTSPPVPLHTPEEIEKSVSEMQRKYSIHLHVNLLPYRLCPWWATITNGVFNIGDPSYGVSIWRARSREQLLTKCEKWIAKDMLRKGRVGEPSVSVREPD